MDENAKSQVNDDELNRMIANIKGQQTDDATSSVAAPADPLLTSAAPSSDAGATPMPVVAAAPMAMPDDASSVAASQPVERAMPTGGMDLDSLKRNAVSELRPLVSKLDLPPEDRFNTLLLVIRSTDDSSLLPSAYEAARQISDDTRRAQALLDVIKEVDFFKQQR